MTISKNEMVQRRAARLVLGDHSLYSSVTDMLGKIGWRFFAQQHANSSLVLFKTIVSDNIKE